MTAQHRAALRALIVGDGETRIDSYDAADRILKAGWMPRPERPTPEHDEAVRQGCLETCADLDAIWAHLWRELPGLAEKASAASKRVKSLTGSYLDACAQVDRLTVALHAIADAGYVHPKDAKLFHDEAVDRARAALYPEEQSNG